MICTDSTHCQAYISEDKRRESWGAGADENWNKISTAVDETTGQIMTYNDEIISAVFHSTSSGMTESAVDVWGRTCRICKVLQVREMKNHRSITVN